MSLIRLLQVDWTENHKLNHRREHNLVAAVVARGLADYIHYLLYTNHSTYSCIYSYYTVKTARVWIYQNYEPYSARECCRILDIPWECFLGYIDMLDHVKDDEAALRAELLRYS